MCLTLCDPTDCSTPGSSVHVILQARILEWVEISFSRHLPHPGIEPASPVSPALARGFSITEILGKPVDDVLSEKKKKKWSIITERDKYVKAIIN